MFTGDVNLMNVTDPRVPSRAWPNVRAPTCCSAISSAASTSPGQRSLSDEGF